MIRKKKDIDFEIKTRRIDLSNKIECSIRAEIAYEKDITSIKEELSKLSKEVYFEDTLGGMIKAFEDSARKEMREILDKLSIKTGKDYLCNIERTYQ